MKYLWRAFKRLKELVCILLFFSNFFGGNGGMGTHGRWLDIRGCWENSSRFQIKINTECLANIIVLDLVRHDTANLTLT